MTCQEYEDQNLKGIKKSEEKRTKKRIGQVKEKHNERKGHYIFIILISGKKIKELNKKRRGKTSDK